MIEITARNVDTEQVAYDNNNYYLNSLTVRIITIYLRVMCTPTRKTDVIIICYVTRVGT